MKQEKESPAGRQIKHLSGGSFCCVLLFGVLVCVWFGLFVGGACFLVRFVGFFIIISFLFLVLCGFVNLCLHCKELLLLPQHQYLLFQKRLYHPFLLV